MSEATANKLVVFFAVGGIGLALWRGKDGSDRYRKVWGVTLLSAAGAATASFAPSLVGPFFALIIVAYFAGHYGQLATVASSIKSQAGVKK